MRCRLLYLVGQLRAGGSERQLVSLLASLDRSRYRPEVAVWNFSHQDAHVASLTRLEVPLHAAPRGASRVTKLLWFRHLVRRLRPEVVHSYSFFTNFVAYFGTLATGAVPIGSRRSNFVRERFNAGPLGGRVSARWPRTQICNSLVEAEGARSDRGFFSPRRLVVVRNGIDLSVFHPIPYASSTPVRILGIGSLIPVKRWDRLLTSAQSLKQQGLDFLIRIVGDGPLREELEDQARALRVNDQVKFLGYSRDVQALLADSAFLVHTSDVEGCPNVIMEAMACGRAVVATNAGETPYLVDDGKTGFVVERRDTTTLVDRMAMLIGAGDLCQRMGEAGREKAEREFGLDRLVAETLGSYRAAGWGLRGFDND